MASSLLAFLVRTEELKQATTTTVNLNDNATTLSTLLLRSKPADEADFDYANSCGLNNCPETKLPGSLSKMTRSSFILLYICLIALCVLSMVVTLLFMDNLKDESESSPEEQNEMQSNENDDDKKKSQIKAGTSHKITLVTVGN